MTEIGSEGGFQDGPSSLDDPHKHRLSDRYLQPHSSDCASLGTSSTATCVPCPKVHCGGHLQGTRDAKQQRTSTATASLRWTLHLE